MELVATIEKVFTTTGESSKGPWTRYDVKAAGKKFQTFKDAVGKQAQKLEGQTVKLTYREVARGEYTNYELDAVEPDDRGAAFTNAEVKEIQSSDDVRQLRIMRQSALDRAISTVAAGIVEVDGADALFAIANTYIDYFVNGVPVLADDGVRF